MSLTLKEKVELYKQAKHPRKEIRLKLQIITNGLSLPKVSSCENKVKTVFKIHEVAKIEPQLNFCAERYKNSQNLAPKENKREHSLIKVKNKLSCLKVVNEIKHNRLELNMALREIEKTVDSRSEEIMHKHNLMNVIDGYG